MKACGLPCETWMRVVGYFRPTNGFNKGKLEEIRIRKYFKIEKEKEESYESKEILLQAS